MSQIVAPPSPPPRRSRRRPLLSEKPETRAIQIGLLGTILIHLLLLIVAPRLFRINQVKTVGRPHANARPLNIQISPDQLISRRPPPKPQPKFVETNPNAAESTPTETNNISNRNQRVAQEKPTPKGTSDHPALEGRKNFQSTQIVSGQLTQPQVSAPPPRPQVRPAPPTPKHAPPRQQQNPLAGFEKKQGDDINGFAANQSKLSDNLKPSPEKLTGSQDANPQDNAQPFAPPQIDPDHPQPRRTLAQRVRPAIFSENKFGTANIGPTAVDARWSNYGVYLQRMIETVQIEWERVLAESKIYPNSGSVVSVKFIMDKKGSIRITGVEPTPGTSDAATRACVTGIAARSPYGDWTDDMISVLGNEQEMTFSFYYQ